MIIDQAGARRLRGGFADADAEPRRRQKGKAAGEGGKPGGQRPEGDADRQQPGTDPAIGQSSDRQRKEDIEQREDRAVEQAHFRVADAQVLLDARIEDGKDVAVEQAEHLGKGHQRQNPPPSRAYPALTGQISLHERPS